MYLFSLLGNNFRLNNKVSKITQRDSVSPSPNLPIVYY